MNLWARSDSKQGSRGVLELAGWRFVHNFLRSSSILVAHARCVLGSTFSMHDPGCDDRGGMF